MNLPNKITLFRVMLIPVFMFFAVPALSWYPENLTVFLQNAGPYLSIIVFIMAGITDIIDGSLARKRNEITILGKFLDPIADKLLVISALLILMVRFDLSSWIVMLIIAREIIVMGMRIIAAGEGVVIAANIWGKVKTVMQIITVVAYLLNDIVDMWYLDDILMGITLIITLWSGYVYLRKNLSLIKIH